jgi:hypothetical protein
VRAAQAQGHIPIIFHGDKSHVKRATCDANMMDMKIDLEQVGAVKM